MIHCLLDKSRQLLGIVHPNREFHSYLLKSKELHGGPDLWGKASSTSGGEPQAGASRILPTPIALMVWMSFFKSTIGIHVASPGEGGWLPQALCPPQANRQMKKFT
jgi:hypothetical protein